MLKYVDLCIATKNPSKAISCLQYCSEIGFTETRDIAKTIVKNFTLDEFASKKIVYIVGVEVLEEAEKERDLENEKKLKESKEKH